MKNLSLFHEICELYSKGNWANINGLQLYKTSVHRPPPPKKKTTELTAVNLSNYFRKLWEILSSFIGKVTVFPVTKTFAITG